MKNLGRLGAAVLAVALGAGGTSLFAQSMNAGDIRGTITDATGAVIPGATVTVLNVDTGVSKSFTSDGAGVFDTGSIVTGNYTVTFSKDGFEQLVRGPITLQVGYSTVNGNLKVGEVSQKVIVNTDIPLLQTESGEQKTTLDAKSMAQLPQTTQDWENFMILLPGATGTPASSAGANNPGQEVAINGNLPYSNVLADGASTTLSHSSNANPEVFENVAELQVNTSTFSAQYGIGGAVFNQISKGGTSQFHGTAYDYFQNDKLNANSFGFASQPTVPYSKYNDFGGSIGGPILKKRMFFYFNYDQIVDHGSSSGTNSIPTQAVMGGDFTGQLPIYDPTTQTIAYDSQGNPYPVRKSFQEEYGSNAIPASMFDSVASKFQQFYPTPSNHISGGKFVTGSTGADGETQNNFYAQEPQSTPYRKYFGRLDWDITHTNRLTMSDTQSDTPVLYPSQVTACPVGCQMGDVDNNNAQVTDVWNISPTTINEARLGYTWQGNFYQDLTLNKGYASQLGWQFAKADDIPAIQFTRNYPYAWIEPQVQAVYKEHVFDPSDVVTMIRGRHILHFGGEFLIYRDDSTAWGNYNAGTMQFSGQYTEQWTLDKNGVASPDTSTGLEYADFLLGMANNWNASVSPEYGARLKSPQVFIQDDWKLRPNLTINLGLRYQINHGWNEIHGNEAVWDPEVLNTATNQDGAYWYGSTKAHGRGALQADVYNTILPRVGFSWQPKSDTTLNGGFGVYSYNWSLDTYGGGMGAAVSSSGSVSDQTNGITPITQLDGTGTYYGTSTALPYSAASTSPTRFNGQSATYNEFHTPVPKIYQYNVSLQKMVGANTMTQLSYVGSHGFNLNYPTDLNAVPEQYFSSNDTAYRPYSAYQSITGSTNNGISNYNSLQAQIQQRLKSGVSYAFNYVWSHFLDDQDSSGWGSREGQQNYQQANNPKANYSNSNFDVRNAFKGYALYELPFGKGRTFLNHNQLLDEVIGGWQVSGTIVLSTGNPFTVYGTQANYQQAGSMMPNWNPAVKNIKPAHQSARCEAGYSGCVNEWYNPAAFVKPADGTFGNVRRNALYGPGIDQVNLSASKTFAIYENVKLNIRADATNAFNHASFGMPTQTLAGTGQTTLETGDAYSWYRYNQNTGALVPSQQISGTTVGGRTVQLGAHINF
ncbi:TonB-dependent receptor [Silvibacterium dinghuense]|uniref:TonB-dependent receptor n=1 Tax=Silvibacterium dinghuense TaxID=1560006 RepID=A0A4Q1S941_9BACT|nr:TonB-dependent receptor [Silvibacterium dinghuense]RXS93409.1 TonB-dependent receptor [Silvibacterium dinghuense]GGH05576.1 cell envelope biogenesis protein OmpA [Silvibacterium dinghuense]